MQWAVLSVSYHSSLQVVLYISLLSTTCRFKSLILKRQLSFPHVVTSVTTHLYVYVLSPFTSSFQVREDTYASDLLHIWLHQHIWHPSIHLFILNISLNQMHVAFSSNTDFIWTQFYNVLEISCRFWFCSTLSPCHLMTISNLNSGLAVVALSFQNALGVTFIAELMAEFSSEVPRNWASSCYFGAQEKQRKWAAVFSLLACFVCVVVFRELGKHQRKTTKIPVIICKLNLL